MPRKWLETVKDYPTIKPGRLYCVRVISIRKKKSPEALLVVLEFLDGPQSGRTLECSLMLPVRPAGRSAAFFQACGIPCIADHKFAPIEAVGVHLKVKFDADGSPTTFVVKEKTHEPNTRP